jgi:hypothetical protein
MSVVALVFATNACYDYFLLPCRVASYVSAVTTCTFVKILELVGKLYVGPLTSGVLQNADLHSPDSHFNHLEYNCVS